MDSLTGFDKRTRWSRSSSCGGMVVGSPVEVFRQLHTGVLGLRLNLSENSATEGALDDNLLSPSKWSTFSWNMLVSL